MCVVHSPQLSFFFSVTTLISLISFFPLLWSHLVTGDEVDDGFLGQFEKSLRLDDLLCVFFHILQASINERNALLRRDACGSSSLLLEREDPQ